MTKSLNKAVLQLRCDKAQNIIRRDLAVNAFQSYGVICLPVTFTDIAVTFGTIF